MQNEDRDTLQIDWQPSGAIVTVLHADNYGMERFELSFDQLEELRKVIR